MPTTEPRVLVMMATYNGEKYLSEQIDSVLAQEGVDVTLRICDDRSSDGTFVICQEYAAAHPNVIVSQNEVNLGVGKNFMQMVYEDGAVGYDYYAFSDQDDVWMPEKLEKAIGMLEEYPSEQACLYHSDIYNVDENLEHPVREIENFESCASAKGTPLIRNWAYGCTLVWNKGLNLLLRGYEPPEFPRIHDAWVYLVAFYCGTVVADYSHAYIMRRLTGNNEVGEFKTNFRTPADALRSFEHVFHASLHPSLDASEYLWEGYADSVHGDKRDTLRQFVHYNDSLANRLAIMESKEYMFPTKQMHLICQLKFLLGRH
jgi:rhamnosyltransferase